LNEYNERDRERKVCQEHDQTRTVTWQDKVRDKTGKLQGLDRTRSGRTRQEEVNRTRTRQVKVRDKIVKDLAKKM
jgi:hypothetical protein